MKKLLMCLLLLPIIRSPAQSNALVVYGEIGAGGGAGPSVKLDLNSVFFKNNVASVGCYFHNQAAINLPADYTGGHNNIVPEYYMRLWTFMYGKIVYFPNTYLIRFSLKGGLAIGSVNAPGYFTPQQQPSPGSFNLFGTPVIPNYYYRDKYTNVAGLVFNPSVELPLSNGFGFRTGVTYVLNSYNNIFNVEGSILFGKLRHRHPRNVNY